MKTLAAAFGISSDFREGEAFDPEAQARSPSACLICTRPPLVLEGNMEYWRSLFGNILVKKYFLSHLLKHN